MAGLGERTEAELRAMEKITAAMRTLLVDEATSVEYLGTILTTVTAESFSVYRPTGRVESPDGRFDSVRLPWEVHSGVEELRRASCRPAAGTWFSARILVPAGGESIVELNVDDEPWWDVQPDPVAYVNDLAQFRRDDAHTPGWLARRLAEGRERIALADGHRRHEEDARASQLPVASSAELGRIVQAFERAAWPLDAGWIRALAERLAWQVRVVTDDDGAYVVEREFGTAAATAHFREGMLESLRIGISAKVDPAAADRNARLDDAYRRARLLVDGWIPGPDAEITGVHPHTSWDFDNGGRIGVARHDEEIVLLVSSPGAADAERSAESRPQTSEDGASAGADAGADEHPAHHGGGPVTDLPDRAHEAVGETVTASDVLLAEWAARAGWDSWTGSGSGATAQVVDSWADQEIGYTVEQDSAGGEYLFVRTERGSAQVLAWFTTLVDACRMLLLQLGLDWRSSEIIRRTAPAPLAAGTDLHVHDDVVVLTWRSGSARFRQAIAARLYSTIAELSLQDLSERLLDSTAEL